MVGRGENLEEILRGFLEKNPDLKAAVVITAEGLPLASTVSDPSEEEELAASTGLTLTLAERASEIMKGGAPKEIILRGENAYQLFFPIDGQGGVSVFANSEAKLGILLYEIRKMVDSIGKTLEEGDV